MTPFSAYDNMPAEPRVRVKALEALLTNASALLKFHIQCSNDVQMEAAAGSVEEYVAELRKIAGLPPQ